MCCLKNYVTLSNTTYMIEFYSLQQQFGCNNNNALTTALSLLGASTVEIGMLIFIFYN